MGFIMGWKLGATEEWMPAFIRKIEHHGLVSDWNKEHPDNLILEGDELMKIDNITFHHNSSLFIANVRQHFWAEMRGKGTDRSVSISIRRPRAIQDAFDEAHPIKEIEVWSKPKHRVTLQIKPELADHLGWEIAQAEDNDSGSGGVVVKSIHDTGLVSRWNERHTTHGQSIAPGDHIVEVNGASWELYDTAKDFSDLVLSELRSGELVRLVLERPVRSVMQFRTNMELGVHMEGQASKAMTTTELPPLEVQSDSAVGATDDGDQAGAADDADDADSAAGAAEDDSDFIGADN
jgi:hypothetical protein